MFLYLNASHMPKISYFCALAEDLNTLLSLLPSANKTIEEAQNGFLVFLAPIV